MKPNKKQTNIFDFLNEEIQTQNIEVPTIEVPSIHLEELLERMKALIEKGIIKQTDKYFRLSFSILPIVENSAYTEEFILTCLAWSDSAVYNDVYENGGKCLKTDEYLNRCDSLGAYTKVAWGVFYENKNITPSFLMEKFNIKEHIRPMIFATGTKEDCEEALKVLVEWNKFYIKPLSELHADSRFNFIRISRRKGEIESTRCMNGECIGGILTRENAF